MFLLPWLAVVVAVEAAMTQEESDRIERIHWEKADEAVLEFAGLLVYHPVLNTNQ